MQQSNSCTVHKIATILQLLHTCTPKWKNQFLIENGMF